MRPSAAQAAMQFPAQLTAARTNSDWSIVSSLTYIIGSSEYSVRKPWADFVGRPPLLEPRGDPSHEGRADVVVFGLRTR